MAKFWRKSLFRQSQTLKSLLFSQKTIFTQDFTQIPKTAVAWYLLKLSQGGLIYLDIDDFTIKALFDHFRLEELGYVLPPYSFGDGFPGAHITVASSFYDHCDIYPEELGKSFTFEVVDVVEIQPFERGEYIQVVVEAPELAAIRKNAGLASTIEDHRYHISIAYKPEL